MAMHSIPIKLLFISLCTLLLSSPLAIGAKLNNLRCPIEPTELAIPKYKSEYKGDIIFFCCAECVDLFDESPEIYAKFIKEIKSNKNLNVQKTFIQKVIDVTWNLFFQIPGTFLAFFTLAICLIFRTLDFAKAFTKSSWKYMLIACLIFDLFYTQSSIKKTSKKRLLIDKVHSTTFLEYGEPLIPAISKLPASISKTYYRGNDERNPGLYNGGNYRTAEFTIDLCNNSNEKIIYNSSIDHKNLFLRVTITKTPNTSKHFWTDEKMNTIYATSNSGKFHWSKDQVIDSMNLSKLDSKNEWQFKYPLEKFSVGDETRLIKGIIYLCEKRFNDSGNVIGGRFHYAFQFDLKTISNKLSDSSDLWMGPLYRKRSLRIWEIPESEWLSTDPIPINQITGSGNNPILIGIDKKD